MVPHLVHDEDEQGQQQQPCQHGQSHHPRWDGLRRFCHPQHRHRHLETHTQLPGQALQVFVLELCVCVCLCVSVCVCVCLCVSHSGAVGRQLRHQVLVRHLDDAERGRSSNFVRTILILGLKRKQTSDKRSSVRRSNLEELDPLKFSLVSIQISN